MRASLALVLATILSACVPLPLKTLRWADVPIRQDRATANPEDKVQLGEHVSLLTHDLKFLSLQVVRIDDEGLVGVALDDKLHRVAYAEIKGLRARRPRWGLTVLTREGPFHFPR